MITVVDSFVVKRIELVEKFFFYRSSEVIGVQSRICMDSSMLSDFRAENR